jgi:hypothetical protein
MMFIKNSANSHGWVNPRDVEDIWRDHFDYFYRELADDADPSKICIFPITCHPDVSGRPHVLLMHERCVLIICPSGGSKIGALKRATPGFRKR